MVDSNNKRRILVVDDDDRIIEMVNSDIAHGKLSG